MAIDKTLFIDRTLATMISFFQEGVEYMGKIDVDTDCLKKHFRPKDEKKVNAGLHPIDQHRYQLHGSPTLEVICLYITFQPVERAWAVRSV